MRNDERLMLSTMQHRVVELIADGCTLREVSAKLGLSHNTVSTHLARLKEKLKARSATHAAVKWALMRAYAEAEYKSWLPK